MKCSNTPIETGGWSNLSRKFTTVYNVYYSRMNAPDLQAQEGLKCGICNRVYTKKHLFVRHLHSHDQPSIFPCSECGKVFLKKFVLKTHRRTHTGDRPFKCPHCGNCFPTRYRLKIHGRQHSGEKPHKCSYCEKFFRSASGLTQHIRTHTKESPFSCAECGRKFKEREKLKRHEYIHSGTKPFMCDQCPVAFRTKNNLVRHLRIHTGETYKCRLCPKEFGELYALKKHHRIKHDKIPFEGPAENQTPCEELKVNTSNSQDTKSSMSKSKTSAVKKTQSVKENMMKAKRTQAGKIGKATCSSKQHPSEENSDINKAVIEKLYLAIGQRDASTVIDENGWHRIPLPAASDLLSRNMDKCCANIREASTSAAVDQQQSHCGTEAESCKPDEGFSNTKSHKEFTRVNGHQGRTTGPVHKVTLGDKAHHRCLRNAEKVPGTEDRRRELTHPSTIEYFPSSDQAQESHYRQEPTDKSYVSGTSCDPGPATYAPESHHNNLQIDSEFHNPHSGTGICRGHDSYPERLCAQPHYHHHLQHQQLGKPQHQHQQQHRPPQHHHHSVGYHGVFGSSFSHMSESMATLPDFCLPHHDHDEQYTCSDQFHHSHYYNIHEHSRHQYDCRSTQERRVCPSRGRDIQHQQHLGLDSAPQHSSNLPLHCVPHAYQQFSSCDFQEPPRSFTAQTQFMCSSQNERDSESLLSGKESSLLAQGMLSPAANLSHPSEDLQKSTGNTAKSSAARMSSHQLLSLQKYQSKPVPSIKVAPHHGGSVVHHKPDPVSVERSIAVDDHNIHFNKWPPYFQPQHSQQNLHQAIMHHSFTDSSSTVQAEAPVHFEAHRDPSAGHSQMTTDPEYLQKPSLQQGTVNGETVSLSKVVQFHQDAAYSSKCSNSSINSVTPSAARVQHGNSLVPQTQQASVSQHKYSAQEGHARQIQTALGYKDKSSKDHKTPVPLSGQSLYNQTASKADVQENLCSSLLRNVVGESQHKEKSLSVSSTQFLDTTGSQDTMTSGCMARSHDTSASHDKTESHDQLKRTVGSSSINDIIHQDVKGNEEFAAELVGENEDSIEADSIGEETMEEMDEIQFEKEKCDIKQINENWALKRDDEDNNILVQKHKDLKNSEREGDVKVIRKKGSDDTKGGTKTKSAMAKIEIRPRRTECVSRYRNLASHHKFSRKSTDSHVKVSSRKIDGAISEPSFKTTHSKNGIEIENNINIKADGSASPSLQRNKQSVVVRKDVRKSVGKIGRCVSEADKFHRKASKNKTSKRATNAQTLRQRMNKTQKAQGNCQINPQIANKISSFTHSPHEVTNAQDSSENRKLTTQMSVEEERRAEFVRKNCIVDHAYKIYKCLMCGKRYKDGSQVRNHVFTSHFDGLRKKCSICGKQFPHKSGLTRHLKTHAAQKPFPCSQCPQAFTAQKFLDNHLKRHNRPAPCFTCSECGKTFPRCCQLKVHSRTHSGEKPYKCSYCSLHFATSFQVRLHERVHTNARPYQCPECQKCFKASKNLALHLRRHTNDRRYLCATCGAAFYELSKLQAHSRVHTGLRPFMCDKCPKAYKGRSLLVRHMRFHTGDTFKCKICSKAFGEQWILRTHIQKCHAGS